MVRVVRRPFGFAGKFCLMILLALVGGLVLAMSEKKLSPSDLAGLFSKSTDQPPAPGTPPPTTPPRPPVAPPGAPPRPPAPPAVPPVVPETSLYSPAKMSMFFTEFDGFLRRGQIKEARELLRGQKPAMVPKEHQERFRTLEQEVGKYHQLLLLTFHGNTVDLPQMAELELRSGGMLVVKNLQESAGDYRYETLTGIKARVTKDTVVNIRKYEKDRAGLLVDEELEKQASYRGFRIAKEGLAWKFLESPQRPASGFDYFELADFCARNGRNARIVPLFAEGLKRDPDLPATVFEKKAERFVDVFLFFISIRSKDDAKRAYDHLTAHYGRSRAFRDKVELDSDVREAYKDLFETPMAVEPKDPPPAPPGPPGPEPPAPPPPPPPAPGEPPAPAPPAAPPPPKPPPPDDDPDRVRPSQKTALPSDAPSRAVDLVRKGDEIFEEAMKRVLNSSNEKNPQGWADENKKALELLNKAHDQCYYPAQEAFEKAKKPIPTALLRRVREVQMTRAMCRKRAVSNK